MMHVEECRAVLRLTCRWISEIAWGEGLRRIAPGEGVQAYRATGFFSPQNAFLEK